MFLLALALLAAPSPSIAPLTDGFPTKQGTAGVSFVLPGGSAPTIGVTYFLANDMAARVDFGLEAPFSPSGQIATFSLGVGLRLYQIKRASVAVFLQPSITFGRSAFAAGTPAQFGAEFLNFGAAAGVEYFFTDHFSAGGTLGLALALSNLGGPAGSSTNTDLTTGNSGLFASIYF